MKDPLDFNRAIIDATADLVCAYKPNIAFYEALGMDGLRALEGPLTTSARPRPTQSYLAMPSGGTSDLPLQPTPRRCSKYGALTLLR